MYFISNKIKGYDNYYYTIISNNWYTLNKLGEFEIIHNFDDENSDD